MFRLTHTFGLLCSILILTFEFTLAFFFFNDYSGRLQSVLTSFYKNMFYNKTPGRTGKFNLSFLLVIEAIDKQQPLSGSKDKLG